MKYWLSRLPLLSLGLLAAAFSVSGQGNGPKAAPTSLDQEARKAAQKVWDEFVTKCGDSYYVVDPGNSSYDGGWVYQWRGTILFDVSRSRPLTAADRLNGIEWDGGAGGRFPAKGVGRKAWFEQYAAPGDRNPEIVLKTWQPWEDNPPDFSSEVGLYIQKKNGSWQVTTAHRVARRKLSCSAVTGPLPSSDVNDGLFTAPENSINISRHPSLSDIYPGTIDPTVYVVKEPTIYALVPELGTGQRLSQLSFHLVRDGGNGLLPGSTLLAAMGGPDNSLHVGANIEGYGPAYLFVVKGAGKRVLIPVSDFEKNARRAESASSQMHP